jgi:hypothetical protein
LLFINETNPEGVLKMQTKIPYERDVKNINKERMIENYNRIYIDSVSFLDEIGVSPSFNGYCYLIEAAAILVNDPSKQMNSREIYKAVANKYGRSPNAVERSISYALKSVGNSDAVYNLYSRYKITAENLSPNMRFIRMFAHHLIIDKAIHIKTDDFAKAACGFLFMTLKEWNFSLNDIKGIIQNVEHKAKSFCIKRALMEYKEFKDELVPVVVNGISVPANYVDMSVYDLKYSNSKLGVRVANALKKENIFYIRDLRSKNVSDLRKIIFLKENYIIEFEEALIRTISG